MNIIKSLLAISMAISVCIAQNVNISGIVTDTGVTAIVGAAVQLEKLGFPTTTGADGSFTITGTVGINDQINQSIPHKLSVKIKNGFLYINVAEKSAAEIVTYTLHGRIISSIEKTFDIGTHSIALPRMGAGIYFYKIKAGNSELIIKSPSTGRFLGSTGVSAQDLTSTATVSRAKRYVPINDVIAVTKDGYLNYRVIVTNSDTSGVEIKMIVCVGTVTDADGNVYQEVRIGKQVWTVENLRTTKYNDGTPVTLDTSAATWADATTEKYCYYANTTNADSIKKYGALYNWYVVSPTNPKKIAPIGLHVPTDTDWKILEKYLVLNGYNWDGTTDTLVPNKIAKSMATKTDWQAWTEPGAVGNDLTKNNRSGFSALGGGYRYNDGKFWYQSSIGYWWSATEIFPLFAHFRGLNHFSAELSGSTNMDKSCGFSVRLLRDYN